MNSRWPLVSLSTVLSLYQEYIDAPEPRLYPKLSVRLYGKGVVLDEPADGALLRMKRHQLARGGQVILSEIWGKKGAIGLVPSEGEGALCTSHFFLFDVDYSRIEQGYLQAIFRANYLEPQLNTEARGTTGYAAVRPKHLLRAQIPLPPLDEQRRIVAQIEAYAAAIEEARGLRRAAVEEAEALFVSILQSVIESLLLAHSNTTIGSFADVRGGKRLPRGESLVTYPTPFPYIRVSDMKAHSVDMGSIQYVPEHIHPQIAQYTIGSEDVYVTIAGTIGYAGRIPAELHGANLTENAAKIVLYNKTQVLADYLVYAIQSPQVQEQFNQKQTVTAQPKLALHRIASTELPLLPPGEQRRIVAYLDDLQARVDELTRLQAESAAELDALLPSILDRAFKGEL